LIRFLKNHAIDKQKWDATIDMSLGGIFYAKSWYLDFVSPQWCALVQDDYFIIMPLPIKQKWGIPLVTQPLLCQQLGLFSATKIDEKVVCEFFEKIPKRFPLVRISLNIFNPVRLQGNNKLRVNYIFTLSKPYQKLCEAFSEDTKRNIKKALQKNVTVQKGISISMAFPFFSECNSVFNSDSLNRILLFLVESGRCEIHAAFYDSKIVSIVFFVFDNARYVSIASATNDIGRKCGANYAIFNSFIKEHAEEHAVLDFEGSSIPSIAKYFAGFGSEPKEYLQIKRWNIL